MTLYLFCLATKGIFLLLVYGLRKLVQRGEIEMPSEKTLSAKKERVAQLVEMLKNSAAGVLVDYKGITVEEDTKLRKELREAGVSYFVEKNTILRFALKEAGLDGITNVLEGTTAIAISNDDQTAPKAEKFLFRELFVEEDGADERDDDGREVIAQRGDGNARIAVGLK